MNIVAPIGIRVASLLLLPVAVVAQELWGGTAIPNATPGAGGSAESHCCPPRQGPTTGGKVKDPKGPFTSRDRDISYADIPERVPGALTGDFWQGSHLPKSGMSLVTWDPNGPGCVACTAMVASMVSGVTARTNTGVCISPPTMFGGPSKELTAGFAPPTTYVNDAPTEFPLVFPSYQSGSQLWWHGFQSTSPEVPEYIEVKDWDGSIAYYTKAGVQFIEYDATGTEARRGDYWQLRWEVDPFDNKTSYVYGTHGELVRVSYPNGVDEVWNWSPSWIGTWAGCSGIEVSYVLTGTTTSAAPSWAMVFENIASNKTHFSGRWRAVIGQESPVVEAPSATAVYDTSSAPLLQSVLEWIYVGGTGPDKDRTKELHHYNLPAGVKSGLVIADPLRVIIETYTYSNSKLATRLDGRLQLMTSYSYTDVATAQVGVSLQTIRVTHPDGSYVIEEFDPVMNRTYRETSYPGPSGKPRAAETTFGIPDALTEPDAVVVDYFYDTTCVCQKPIRVETYSLRSGAQSGKRVTRYEYDPLTKLVTHIHRPNPATTGTATEVTDVITYTYDASALWSPRWVESETTPSGVTTYSYPNPIARQESRHGFMQGKVVRSVNNVTILTGLTAQGTTTQGTTNVSDSVIHNIPNNPAFPSGIAYSGPVSGFPRGQVRVAIDGDQVEHRMTYDSHGWVSSTIEGDVSNIFTHDAWGRLTSLQTNTQSSGHAVAWTIEQGWDLQPIREYTTSGPTAETKYFYDRWGNTAVVLRKNVNAAGGSPTQYGVSSAARAWVRSEYLWDAHRLHEARVDRRPLDEGDSSPFSSSNPLFLVTRYEYDIGASGVSRSVIAPNGSVTKERYDGFGTPFHVTVSESTGSGVPTLEVSRIYNDEFLQPSVIVKGPPASANDRRVTTIKRNVGGAVIEATEPTAPAPFGGYVGYLGGAKHVFAVDSSGRTTQKQVFESTTLRGSWRFAYDQLDRLIKTEADVLGVGTGTHVSITGYAASKATQVHKAAATDVAQTTYTYDGVGRVFTVTNAAGTTTYTYVPGTNFVLSSSQTVGAPSQTFATGFQYDGLGRTTQVKQISGVPGVSDLVTALAYNSFGMVEQQTDPMGRVQKMLRDALGRPVEHVRVGDSGAFIRNWSAYTDGGLPKGRTFHQQKDGLGHETRTHFDWAGRMFLIQKPGADTSTLPLAGASQPHAEHFAYDALSQITHRYDGDGGDMVFAYDGLGRQVLRYLDKAQENIATFNTKHVLKRDVFGNVIEAGSFGSSNGGSGNGTVLNHSWPVLNEAIAYDSIGRVHQEAFATAFHTNIPTVTSSFNGAERFRRGLNYLETMGSSTAALSLQFTPDSSWRISQVDWNRTGSALQTLATYSWLGGLRKTRTTSYGGASTNATGVESFTYDEFGRLKSIIDSVTLTGGSTATTTNSFEYEYDAASNLKKEKYVKVNSKAGDRFTYDAYHRLKDAYMGVDTAVMSAQADPTSFSASSTSQLISYDLDKAQNRLGVTETNASGSTGYLYELESSGLSNRYAQAHDIKPEYDKRGNLIYNGTHYIEWDADGNAQSIWAVREQAAAAMQGSPEDGDKYIIVNEKQALDDAKQEVYDDVENLLHRVPLEHKNPTFRSRLRKPIPGGVIKVPAATGPTSGGGMPRFVIPADLELVALYGYDAFHRRVIRVVVNEDTYITSYDGWREAVEHTLSGVTAAPKKQFVYGSRLDEMLAYRRNTGTAWETYYIQHGGQDTAAKLVNESGAVVERYEYDPYGKATVYNGSGSLVGDGSQSAYGLPHMWKGIRRDPETGLLYMRHRFYSVVTGQFLSSDPIGVWGDSGNMGNEYSYAWNRPLVVGDPLGLQTDTTKSGSPSTTPPTFEEWAPTVKTDKGREVGPSKSKKNDGDEFADRKKQTEIDKKELVDQHKNAKVVGDSSLRYNCGGYVFLGGKAWLNVDIPAPRILKDNGYKRVEKDADVKPGDVVTYLNTNRGIRGNPKNIEHVGIVIGVGENGKVRVRSKWGAGPLVEHDVDEVPNDYKDGRRVVNVCYYRTARGSNDTSVPPLNPGPGGAASPPSKVPQGPEGEKR